MKQEIWKPVVGYEGLYEVSNLGRVKSLNYKNSGKEGIMKGEIIKGYLRVHLNKTKNFVHRLVWEAFKGKIEGAWTEVQIDHINCNKIDNRLENLRLVTTKENANNALTKKRKEEMLKKRAQDPEWRRKNAEAAKKLAQDPEWVQNVAEANRRKAQDPEWLRKNAEANKKKAQDPEWRRKNAEAAKKLAQDPEWQRKHTEGTRKARCKPVDQYTLDGQLIKRWPSATDAARELGLSQGYISACCRGEYNKANGFRWRFAD